MSEYLGMTAEFPSELDPGPLDPAILALDISSPTLLAKLLGYAQSVDFTKLHQDLASLWSLESHDLKAFTTEAVVEWIFLTNKLDGAGFRSLRETKHALASETRPADESASLQSKETWATLNLLAKTYAKDPTLTKRVFDERRLAKLHQLLLPSLPSTRPTTSPSSVGKLRSTGLKTKQELDGSHRIHPHHSLLPSAVRRLANLTFRLSNEIDKLPSSVEKTAYTFALAAFLQFHFLELQPFEAGNGRLGRFLSKLVLDSVCTFPIPMFPDPSRYFACLEQGRSKPPAYQPQALFELLFQVASVKVHSTLNLLRFRYRIAQPHPNAVSQLVSLGFSEEAARQHADQAQLTGTTTELKTPAGEGVLLRVLVAEELLFQVTIDDLA